MAKHRYIDTYFWEDDYIAELPKDGKHLYMYLLTNPKTELLGIYKISINRISYDTAISKESIRKHLKGFAKDSKAFYLFNHIFVRRFFKNQFSRLNPNMIKGVLKSFNDLPVEVKSLFGNEVIKDSKGLLNAFDYFNSNSNSDLDSNKREKEEKIYKKENPTSPKKPKEEKPTWGEFNNVRLTSEEYGKFVSDFGLEWTMAAVEILSKYIPNKDGKPYKDHTAVLRQHWMEEAVFKQCKIKKRVRRDK